MNLEEISVLAEPTRARILNLVSQRSYCVSAIAAILELSPSSVSQHLKILREAGFVVGIKYGYNTHYRVDREKMAELAELIQSFSCEKPKVCRNNGFMCDVAETVGCRLNIKKEQEDTAK